METRDGNVKTGNIHFGTMAPKIDPKVLARRDGKTGNFLRDAPKPGSKEAEEQEKKVHAMIARNRRRLGLPVDTGKMPDGHHSDSVKDRQDRADEQRDTLDYVLEQKDVNVMNKLSRKVGAITSPGDASGKEWKKCVNAQLARDTCSGGYQIGSDIPVEGCRVSNGYDPDRANTPTFLVPDSIKAPMSQSGKRDYTLGYDRLKNILVNNDGPSSLQGDNRTFSGQTARCEMYGLETRKGGRKTRSRKRGRKTRDKKRVKKTRTKRKHVKKLRSRKRGRKTHGRKMSKKRGTRKRSYRKRR